MFVLHWSSLLFVLSLSTSLSLFSFPSFLVFGSFILCGLFPLSCPGPIPLSLCLVPFFPSPSFSPAVGSDLKDIQNNKNRYLIASENQRPGHFSTAPIGSLTASPSSGSLCSQVGLQSVTSIQERIMSTPGGEEAIERLKVGVLRLTAAVFKVPQLSALSAPQLRLLLSPSPHWRWKKN